MVTKAVTGASLNRSFYDGRQQESDNWKLFLKPHQLFWSQKTEGAIKVRVGKLLDRFNGGQSTFRKVSLVE